MSNKIKGVALLSNILRVQLDKIYYYFLKYVSRRTSRSSGEGAPRVKTLVAYRFAYEAFRRSPFFFFETKNVDRRSFRWFAYRLPSAIFVYHSILQAYMKYHNILQACISSTARAPTILLPDVIEALLRCCHATVRTSSADIYIYIYIYILFFCSNSRD